MHKRIVSFILLCPIALSPLRAQLHVISGSPTPQRYDAFAAALVRVGEDGTVSRIASLVAGSTAKVKANAGLFWISVNQEAREAVLLPAVEGSGHFVAIDLDAAAVVKECDLPATPMPVVYFHLADLAGRGLALAEEMFADAHEKYAGMLLDKAVACENSLVDMAPTDILNLRILGRTGVSDMGNDDTMDVQVDAHGTVALRLLGVTLPLTIPEAMMTGMRSPLARILVDNPRLVAIGLFERAGPHRVLVYRKRDQTWYRLSIPSERVFVADGQSTPTPWLTGFGDFLALTEARTRDALHKESAGKESWRKESRDTGPSVASRLAEESVVFPGRLHLFDVEHGRTYMIETGQADSEILLVEGGLVYYRIGDSLYRRSIGETTLGAAQLIATSELLGDAHWAFIRHP